MDSLIEAMARRLAGCDCTVTVGENIGGEVLAAIGEYENRHPYVLCIRLEDERLAPELPATQFFANTEADARMKALRALSHAIGGTAAECEGVWRS